MYHTSVRPQRRHGAAEPQPSSVGAKCSGHVGMPPQFNMPLLPRFLWLAFFPQFIFWVGFTVVIGSLSGSVATLLLRRKS